MTIFVSAKTAVIQLVALDLHRFEPTAILGKRGERCLASSLAIGLPLGLEARHVVEHLPGLGLGQGPDLIENALGRAHANHLSAADGKILAALLATPPGTRLMLRAE